VTGETTATTPADGTNRTSGSNGPSGSSGTMSPMESTDRRILALLESDGRMSWTELGREAGLSTSAAQQRVRRMEAKGIIKGYHADIDPVAVDAGVTAFIMIRPVDPARDDDIPPILSELPAVRDLHSVAGTASYLIRVQVASPHHLDQLLNQIRRSCRCSTETTVVLNTLFDSRPMVDDRPDDEDADADPDPAPDSGAEEQ
jgi:Lrp/AsnC family leucine-responsive transcriptional regulator